MNGQSLNVADAERSYITGRWLEYEGELRAGLLRVLLITCFYGVELYQYLSATQVDDGLRLFHRQATYISATWLLVSLGALVAITRQYLPAGLKYTTSVIDCLLLTAVAWFGSGAASPLVCLYLLLVMMAGLRGSLRLIWFTTISSLICFVFLLYAPLYVNASGKSVESVKPIEIMVIMLGIAASGVVTGQVVRMVRQIVSEVYLRNAAQAPAPKQGAQA